MIRWRSGTVRTLGRSWRGAQELTVALQARHPDDPPEVPALAYLDLVGAPVPGDRVLLNTNAYALGLGTGGYALVIALPDRLPADRTGSGHLVKARYTPQQAIVAAADEPGSTHHELLHLADDLAGLPVVTADLHSALPAILAGIRADAPHARVGYLMTDGGALPAAFSRTLDRLADGLAGVITVGQAFGGDLETVTLHSGLLAARHVLDVDIAVVTQGPGNLGTDTRWGFSGVAVGEAVNAATVLGGRPVGALRISDADSRQRHRGLSHHSLTAYGRVAMTAADLPVPNGLPQPLAEQVQTGLAALAERHKLVTISETGLDAALRASPVRLSTMGRGLDQDYWYFLAQAAAGRHAASMII